MGLLILIVIVLMGLATIGMVGYLIYYYVLQGLLAPTRSALARVLWKQQKETEINGPPVGNRALSLALGEDDTITLYQSWDYFVTFQFLDGRKQEFQVSEAIYASLHEMDEGLLIYKGNLFKQFLPKSTDPGSVPPYPQRRP